MLSNVPRNTVNISANEKPFRKCISFLSFIRVQLWSMCESSRYACWRHFLKLSKMKFKPLGKENSAIKYRAMFKQVLDGQKKSFFNYCSSLETFASRYELLAPNKKNGQKCFGFYFNFFFVFIFLLFLFFLYFFYKNVFVLKKLRFL